MKDDSQLLVEAIEEARRSVKLLTRVVAATSAVPRGAPGLDEVARGMQELAFQTWLLAAEARAEASRLARLSGRETRTSDLGDAS